MADIDVKCPNCGNVITLSEFVDLKKIDCHKCGKKLDGSDSEPTPPAKEPVDDAKPETPEKQSKNETDINDSTAPEVKPPAKSRLKISKAESPDSEKPKEQTEEDSKSEDKEHGEEWEFVGDVKKNQPHKIKDPKLKMGNFIWSWVLFLILAPILAYTRYGGILAENLLEKLQFYGPFVIAVFHFLILGKAFKDSIMQGVLCLFVPFYSFYYLFMVSDDFFLRAVVGGLIAGMGQDSFMVFCEISAKVLKDVKEWIETAAL
jgi:hypothetical protein